MSALKEDNSKIKNLHTKLTKKIDKIFFILPPIYYILDKKYLVKNLLSKSLKNLHGHTKSLNIENNIRPINKKNPNVINLFIIFGFGFLPNTASNAKNTK